MSQSIINSLSVKELKELKKLITSANNIEELKNIIEQELNKREKPELNERYLLSTIPFDIEERKILEENGLKTVSDLRDCNINRLKGITKRTQESLTWAQDFYNLDHMDNVSSQNKTQNQEVRKNHNWQDLLYLYL